MDPPWDVHLVNQSVPRLSFFYWIDKIEPVRLLLSYYIKGNVWIAKQEQRLEVAFLILDFWGKLLLVFIVRNNKMLSDKIWVSMKYFCC